ncbi:hypothetical protein EGT74_20595 [Chitinophaga lutea]|uniref:Uncharacterized protein n=1 Tax=Chitinophaga lutea TaxID=2488634 RepID=A0A3N4PMH8_9BACT|nr:hypothetical protein EGT74_20595 [Chitinophaga lutea]
MTIFLVACKKEGVLQVEKEIVNVSISSFWAEPEVVTTLRMDNVILSDSFGTKMPLVINQTIEKVKGKQHLTLTDRKTGNVWIDTSLTVNGNFFSASILQLGEGVPQLIVKNEEQSDPAKKNFGFYYTDPNLPGALELELYRVVVNGSTIVSGADAPYAVFKGLTKGKFLGFTGIPYAKGFGVGERIVFKLKNAQTGEYVPNAGEIDPIRYTKGGRFFLPGAANLESMANHIFSIRVNVRPTGNTYTANSLVSY